MIIQKITYDNHYYYPKKIIMKITLKMGIHAYICISKSADKRINYQNNWVIT